jgi:hypothetical protein
MAYLILLVMYDTRFFNGIKRSQTVNIYLPVVEMIFSKTGVNL